MKPETVLLLITFLRDYVGLSVEASLKIKALEKTLEDDPQQYQRYKDHLATLRGNDNYAQSSAALEALQLKLIQDH
jgi:hypothetical protein